ncbi:MAG: cytidine deaminase [bacterium]|nr:cytidine deaminase [bacterium]
MKKHNRPSWDEYFITITKEVATRSSCLRRKVGAVLVKNNRIISTGYNGSVRNTPHCENVGCLRNKLNVAPGTRHELCRGLHAEQNALLFAANSGVTIEGSTVYCMNQPCILCAKMLVQAGIKRVVYIEDYPDDFAKEIFKESRVKLEKFQKNSQKV